MDNLDTSMSDDLLSYDDEHDNINTKIKIIDNLISCLTKQRSSNYNSWSNMAHALYNELELDGLNSFINFSKMSNYYNQGTTIKLYIELNKNNDRDKSLNLNSIHEWAKQDNLGLYNEIFNKKSNQIIVNSDKEAALIIYNQLKDRLKFSNGMCYLKKDTSWIYNTDDIKDYLLDYISDSGIGKSNIKGEWKSYSQNARPAEKILKLLLVIIKREPDNAFYRKLHTSTIGKLCFLDGVLDIKTKIFTDWKNISIDEQVYTIKNINRKYNPDRNEELIKLIKDQVFKMILGNKYERFLQLSSIGIAEHTLDKLFINMSGNKNRGKVILENIFKNAFDCYIDPWMFVTESEYDDYTSELLKNLLVLNYESTSYKTIDDNIKNKCASDREWGDALVHIIMDYHITKVDLVYKLTLTNELLLQHFKITKNKKDIILNGGLRVWLNSSNVNTSFDKVKTKLLSLGAYHYKSGSKRGLRYITLINHESIDNKKTMEPEQPIKLCKICDPDDLSNYTCNKCFNGLTKRKEKMVEEYLKQNIDINFECNTSSIFNGRSRKRPDIFFKLDNHCIIVEIDENQHNAYNKEKDRERTNEIISLLKSDNLSVIMIRYNPDQIKSNNNTVNIDDQTRLDYLVKVVKNELMSKYHKFTVKLIHLFFDDNQVEYDHHKEKLVTDQFV